MKAKTLATIIAVLPTFALIHASDAAPTGPMAPATPPTVQPVPRPVLKMKTQTDLSMNNVGTVPGEKRTYSAVLKTKVGDKPLANKRVSLRIERKQGGPALPGQTIAMGEDMTDANGTAKIAFSCPELAQGNYTIKGSYAGDEETASASEESNLLVVKAMTQIELSSLMWGTYKNEPGAPYGTISIKLVRQSDDKSLDRPLQITVNGKTWTLPKSTYHQVVLQPMNASSWNVKVQYEGDDYSMSTGIEKNYNKPN